MEDDNKLVEERREKLRALRAQGEVVVVDLLGKAEYHHELNCDREMVLRDGKWVVVEMNI